MRFTSIVIAAGTVLTAVGAERAAAQQYVWNQPGGATWGTNVNWTPNGVPDEAGESALIDLGATFTITLGGSPNPDSVLMLSTGATIEIMNASLLGIGGAAGFVNNGTVIVNSTTGPNFTSLRFGAPAPLSGTGLVRLNSFGGDLNAAYIETTGPGEVLHQSPHRIAGTGRIPAKMTNDSLIIADQPGRLLEITGPLTQGAGGELRADTGIISLGNGAAVSGGTLTSANGGTWQVNSSPSVSGVTSNANGEILNTAMLRVLAGGMTNNAVLSVNNGSGSNFTRVRMDESATIGGIGSIHLRSNGNLDTAYIEGVNADAVLTQGPSHSITGSGRIYATTVNQGTVRATTPGQVLEIRGLFTQQGAGSIIGDNADAAMGAGALVSGGTINSVGTGLVRVTGDPRLSGSTNLGNMSVDNTALLRLLSGGMVNNGILAVNNGAGPNFTRIRIDEPCTIGGSGSIVLNSNGNLDTAYMESVNGAAVVNGGSHTIRGTGRVYSVMTNDGTILADRAGQFLEIRSAVTQGAGGAVRGNPGIAGLGTGAVINGGSFASANGGSVRTTGSAKASGVTNIGGLEIGNATSLSLLSGGLTNNGEFAINDGTGPNFTSLIAEESCELGGSGVLTLRALAGSPDTAYIETNAQQLTHGPAHTITGSGRLYGQIRNLGTIRGSTTDSGAFLRIRGQVTQEGAGTIVGEIGAVGLEGGTVNGGTFQSAGGAVRAFGGTSAMNGVTNQGAFNVDNAARVVTTAFVNNGTVVINTSGGPNFTSLSFPGAQMLGGNGSVLLNVQNGDLNTAYMETVSSELTLGQGQTIRGSGRLFGQMVSRATISPGATAGAIGRIESFAPFTLAPESRLEIDVHGEGAGQFDVLGCNSSLALAGKLTIDVVGWNPADTCASIDFITGPAITGKFDGYTLNVPPPGAGRVWRLDYQPNRVSLRLTCPSDLSGDCIVEDLDFTLFLYSYNILDCADPAMPQDCPSDLNGDGVVDDADFQVFVLAYNALLCP